MEAGPPPGISAAAARQWVESHSLDGVAAPSSVAEAWKMVLDAGYDAYAKRFGSFSPSDSNDCWAEAKQCREYLKNYPFCEVGDRYQAYKGEALQSCHGETGDQLGLVGGPQGCRVLPLTEIDAFLRRHPKYQQLSDCPGWVPGKLRYPTEKQSLPFLEYSHLPQPWRNASDLYIYSSFPYNTLARAAFRGIGRHERWERRAAGKYLPHNVFAKRVFDNFKLFDEIFRNPKLVHYTTTPILLFRGTDLSLKQPYPYEFTDQAFVSTTTIEDVAKFFAERNPSEYGVVTIIHVPAGIPYVAGQNPDQGEVVLPRGLTFRSVPSSDGYAHLFVIPTRAPPLPRRLGRIERLRTFPPQQFSLPSE